MHSPKFIWRIMAALLLVLAPVGYAADVYVSSGGNSGNDGLTSGTPKGTLADALAIYNAQPAGSVLHVLSNLSETAVLPITANGTSGSPMIIRSDPASPGFTLSGVVLEVTGTYVSIQNLSFNGLVTQEAAVVVYSPATGCTVDTCTFTGFAGNGAQTFVKENLVAPIQVRGAADLTVRNCIFNANEPWDYCVVLSDAVGTASGITFDGCTVNSNNNTGGLRAYRAYDDVAVTSSNFITMRRAAWEFSYIYANSIVDPGTATGLLLQDLNITGHSEGASFNAAIHFRECSAENIEIRRVTLSEISGNGQDGIRIHGASIDNIVLDHVEFTYPPIGNNAYYVPFTMETGVSVSNVTIMDCSFTAAVAIRCEAGTNFLSNVLIKDTRIEKTPYRATNNIMPISSTTIRNFTMENVTIIAPTGDDKVAFFNNPVVNGVTIRGCQIVGDGGDESIVMHTGAYSNILIEDSEIAGDGHGISIKNTVTTVNGCIIRGCTLTALGNGTTDAGAISFNDQGSGGPVMTGVTLENLWLHGNFGIYLEGAQLENTTIDNIDMTGDGIVRRGIEARSCTFTNVEISDTVCVGPEYGLNISDCGGSGLTLTNVSAIADVTPIANAGINVGFGGDTVTIDGVTVDGGGTAEGLVIDADGATGAGWTVQNCALSNCVGAGLRVTGAVSGLSFLDCTMTNCTGAGVRVTGPVADSTFTNITVNGVTGGPGLFVDNSAATVPAGMASGITFRSCMVDGADIGIDVQGTGHTVQGCTVENSATHGIIAVEPSAILSANADIMLVSNTVRDCPLGVALALEGKNSTVGWNTSYRTGAGILVRSGVTSALAGSTQTTGNTILRNCVYGGTSTATGVFEEVNDLFAGDTGPANNTYMNNTATDWGGHGSTFIGSGNTIQNNIFAFNGGSGLRIQNTSGLTAGHNCAALNTGVDFDGIAIDYTTDIWYDPDLVSRTPGAANFYLLSPTSGCLDRGTPPGTGVDLGCRESGISEVASWRLY